MTNKSRPTLKEVRQSLHALDVLSHKSNAPTYKPTESELMRSIINALEYHGRAFRLNVIGSYTKDGRFIPPSLPRGTSDILFIRNGRAYFLEVKTAIGKASPEQLEFIANMQSVGAVAGIVRSIDEAYKLTGIKD